MTSSTAWPENVIARYLNAVGATVDITDDSHIGRVSVRCQGCTWADHYNTGGLIDDTDAQNAERVAAIMPGARQLTQSHAETCRALPNPNA